METGARVAEEDGSAEVMVEGAAAVAEEMEEVVVVVAAAVDVNKSTWTC